MSQVRVLLGSQIPCGERRVCVAPQGDSPRSPRRAEKRRRQEETAEARKQKRRQIIQRVKDRADSGGPSSTTDIERELSELAADDLPEWELVP